MMLLFVMAVVTVADKLRRLMHVCCMLDCVYRFLFYTRVRNCGLSYPSPTVTVAGTVGVTSLPSGVMIVMEIGPSNMHCIMH